MSRRVGRLWSKDPVADSGRDTLPTILFPCAGSGEVFLSSSFSQETKTEADKSKSKDKRYFIVQRGFL